MPAALGSNHPFLHDPLQRTVRNMTIAALQEQQGGQHAGKTAVAILGRVDGQKMDDKRSDHQQRMQLFLPNGGHRSADQVRHQSRGVEWGRRLENNTDAPAIGIERLYIVGKRYGPKGYVVD